MVGASFLWGGRWVCRRKVCFERVMGFENVIETKSLKFAIPLSNDYFCIRNESEKSLHE